MEDAEGKRKETKWSYIAAKAVEGSSTQEGSQKKRRGEGDGPGTKIV